MTPATIKQFVVMHDKNTIVLTRAIISASFSFLPPLGAEGQCPHSPNALPLPHESNPLVLPHIAAVLQPFQGARDCDGKGIVQCARQ
jgi:hypothetical protein